MPRTALSLRILIPAVLFGLIVGISFIEAPLKFLAPGVTIPIGLGIGRLVFTAANLVAVAGLVLLTVVSIRPRAPLRYLVVLASTWLVLLFEVLVVRPPLNARTDALLAGVDPGESPWHYIYIACDVLMLALLATLAVMAARAVVRVPAESD